MEGVEPTTPRLQITCSGQLSYFGVISKTPFVKGIAKIGIKSDSPKLFQRNSDLEFFVYEASPENSSLSCVNMPSASMPQEARWEDWLS